MYDATRNLYYRKSIGPCKGCVDRAAGCHGSCEGYAEWVKKETIVKEHISKQKLDESIKKQHEINKSLRRKKGYKA